MCGKVNVGVLAKDRPKTSGSSNGVLDAKDRNVWHQRKELYTHQWVIQG